VNAGSGWISFQVVQALNVTTRRITPPFSLEDAHRLLEDVLIPLWRVMPSRELYALDVRARYRFSFYDSLIVAAGLTSGCVRLFSEDLQSGQTIDGLRIQNPFAGV
jgi:predicted nucleic acid-binding protein